MAQSPEYPDLKWVVPKAWNSGRASGQPSVIVIHTTEGSSHGNSAEDGAAYDARRTDGTSAHYYIDNTSVVQCVRTTDRANTARASGNRIGIHYELCGRAAFTPAQWSNAYGTAMLRLAAKQAARDAKKHGIPIVKLSVADVKAGKKGFCGHVDISYAFGESDHTDPGKSFPWATFLGMVKEYATGGVSNVSAKDVIDALKSAEGKKLIAEAVFNTDNVIPAPGAPKPGKNPDGTDINTHWGAASYVRSTYESVRAALAAVQALAKLDTVDEAKLARELAPAVATALVPLLPAGVEVTEEALRAAFTELLTGGKPTA